MKVYCHRPTVLYQADKDDFFFRGGGGGKGNIRSELIPVSDYEYFCPP